MVTSITIVTPSYNHCEYIEETILSVLSQEYPRVEYIVIDGGSQDGTKDILEKYQNEIAYWISEPDEGQTDALIKGFSLATGDIMAWLNSDDVYMPNVLNEVAEYFDKNPDAQFIYGDAVWTDRKGNKLRDKREIPFNRYIWLHDYNYIPQPSTFWRRSLYLESGGLDASFSLAMDADLWERFSRLTNPRHISRIWSRMRFYPEQRNQALRSQSNAEDAVIRKRRNVHVSGPIWLANHIIAKGTRIIWKTVVKLYGR